MSRNTIRLIKAGKIMLGFISLWAGGILAKAPIISPKSLFNPPPKIIRTCCSFGVDVSIARIPFAKRTNIISLAEMGTHQYMGSKIEGNGIIYSKKGGFIDLGHLRDYADWTAWLYVLLTSHKDVQEPLSINLGIEGGNKTIVFKHMMLLTDNDFYQLAGKIAYDLSVWHEIATWFGASYLPLIPERYSSFSPEDLFSNLLGIKLGIQALKSDLEYNDAMTLLIANTLDSLQVVSSEEGTYQAMKKVENIWWTSKKALPSKGVLLKRYLDTEYHLSPWMLPGEIQDGIFILSKPDAYLSFFYEFKIKLNQKFPLKHLYPLQLDRTINQKDFSILIKFIEKAERDFYLKFITKQQRSRTRKIAKRVSGRSKK